MARKIKFALEMADGTLISNLEDLQKHIKNNDDVKKLVEYYLDGRLDKWLLDRYYEEEAKALQTVDKDDPDFTCKLCKAIGADYTPVGSVNIELIEYEKKMRKALEEVTSDNELISNAGCTVSTQSELDFLIKNGKKTIYLWGDSFKLPLVNDMSYIGILGKPLVDIDIVDLDSLKSYGIKFENVNLSEVIRKAKEEAKRKIEEEEAKRKIEEEEAKRKIEEEKIRLEQLEKAQQDCRRQLEEQKRKLEELRRQAEEDRIRREEERRAEEEKIRREEGYRAEEAIRRQLTNAKVGDYIKFGNYPQTANGDIKPIEWQVLEKENNKMLVISKYGLDRKRLNNFDIVNEICHWLKVDFYNKAFNDKEKKSIKSSNLSDVGTTDNVFLLSGDFNGNGEVNEYFANDESRKCKANMLYDDMLYDYEYAVINARRVACELRRCKATEYAVKNGAWVADSSCGSCRDNVGYSVWWLRSPSSYDDYVCLVTIDGYVGSYRVCSDDYVIRPALWINL